MNGVIAFDELDYSGHVHMSHATSDSYVDVHMDMCVYEQLL